MRAIFALFVRSIRQDTRAKLPPILRTALVLILLVIICMSQKDFGRYSDQGLNLLITVMMLNLGFLGIAAVGIFPAAIAEEKEDETLPLLRMTNLNPISILIGKFAPQFLTGVMLLAVQIPFTLIARALGGITIEQVLQGYAILGATLFFLCCLALLFSVWCRTVIRAGVFTAFTGVMLYVGLPVLFISLMPDPFAPGSAPDSVAQHFARAVFQINPFWSLLQLLGAFRGGGSFSFAAIWLNAGAGIFCFLLAWRLFDRHCMQTAEPVARKKVQTGQRAGRLSRTWKMAVAWKEFHFTIGGWRGFRRRLYIGAGLFAVMWAYTKWINPPWEGFRYYYDNGARDEDYYFWGEVSDRTTVFVMIFAGLDVLIAAGRLFGQERRDLTLSSLVSLPWTPRRIFSQKVLGCLPVLLPWLVVVFVSLYCRGEVFRTELFYKLLHSDWNIAPDDVAHITYVLSQGVCLLLLIVFFSLWIRRGALPVAIVVVGLWNVLFFIVADQSRGDEDGAVIIGTLFSVGAAIATYFAIIRRMLAAATED